MRSSLTLVGAVSLGLASIIVSYTSAAPQQRAADLVVTNARITTMDAARPRATAFAVQDGKFIAVGEAAEMAAYRGDQTRVIDARGHTLIPGLNAAHAVRSGRYYNLELRWDGVDSLERGLAMIRKQAKRTPRGQWVRVIGGWSPFQFREKRMPTVRELNDAAPDTPTFVLFPYRRGWINRAAVRALGLNEGTQVPPGGRYEFVDGGAILYAEPDPTILDQLIARLPQLSAKDEVNSTLHFYRELNRFGLTGVVDTGGGALGLSQNHAGSKTKARGLEYGYAPEGGAEFLAHSIGDRESCPYVPPTRKMLEPGIPVGVGTDGTLVSSYNPWTSLYWLVSGKTVGGTQLLADGGKLTREEALRVFTLGNASISQEETGKGRIAPGQYADFAVLSADYFTIPEEQIKNIKSLLTVVRGKIDYAAGPFERFAPPPLPPVSPRWSPVAHFGGYENQGQAPAPPERPAGPPPFKQLRYDEDYSYLRDPAARTGSALSLEPLKYIPLNRAGDRYLSIGGEIRQQFEFYNHPNFGLDPVIRDGYLLQRYMLHGDLHLGPSFRLFGQLKSNLATFQEGPPGPTDEDRLDVHQAFFDLRRGVSRHDRNSITLRVGRQEMLYGSQRLISVREGPNVRRSFDAVRVLTKLNPWQVDGFFSRPVETDPGIFDDGIDAGARFWGIYATGPINRATGMKADFYYLGLDQPEATFAQGTADELRHSVGTRLFGNSGALDYNFEGVYQWGRFGNGKIRAWTVASDTGYTFASAPLSPRVALRADVTSGDADPTDRSLNTFNPLFPKGNYFGESAILGPLNLIDIHPMVQLHLSEAVSLDAGWTWYWRYSKGDGIYGNGLNLIQAPAGNAAHYIGNELSFVLNWEVNRQIGVTASYSHFFAGTFLEETGPGKDVDYFAVAVSYRF